MGELPPSMCIHRPTLAPSRRRPRVPMLYTDKGRALGILLYGLYSLVVVVVAYTENNLHVCEQTLLYERVCKETGKK